MLIIVADRERPETLARRVKLLGPLGSQAKPWYSSKIKGLAVPISSGWDPALQI